MAYGFGKKNIVKRNGYYVPGQGTFEREANVYQNDLGEKVVQSAGVLRNDDGTLHAAYKGQPGTRVAELIKRQRAGFPLSAADLKEIEDFWKTNPTAGLPSVNDLGGGGRIVTKKGTPNKYFNF